MIAATQLYVWTQLLAREGRRVEECLDLVFAEVRAAGFPACEGFLSWFDTARSAERVRLLLAEHRLSLPSVYTGGSLHDPDRAPAAVEEIAARAGRAAAAGVRGVTMNPDVVREGKTESQLACQAEWLNRLGARLRTEGAALWVHNHDPEMADGGREVHSNMRRTDPALVGFCADTHWIWRGGGDPYEYLETYSGRLGSLHLRNSREGIWSESLGDGDLDHPRIAAILRCHAFDGPLIVELAIEAGTPQTRSRVENQRRSREYLRSVFGA